jgi:hypothetical protein
MATTKVTQLNKKSQKTSLYVCHIYGLNGHKMIDCPKFTKTKKMSWKIYDNNRSLIVFGYIRTSKLWEIP